MQHIHKPNKFFANMEKMLKFSFSAALVIGLPFGVSAKKVTSDTKNPPVIISDKVIVETPAYRWVSDSIIQGPFKAFAPDDSTIISNYWANPGYFMPVDKEWHLKNDISAYPRMSSSNRLHNAIYNMGLDEMVNAIEPDSTLRTGKEWPGVWTRDVSYSIILSMAMLQPEVSRISLEHKISPEGTIIQDTGSGGAWPVSSDREIWGIAAFEIYKATGDEAWLQRIYPVIKKSLETDYATIFDSETGLVRGETSFIDWREQSYPRWMQTADIYRSEAMGTTVVHAQAWHVLSEIARLLGYSSEAKTYAERSKAMMSAINNKLWSANQGYYSMYLYGRDNLILNPRAETLGESLAILFDVASPERAKIITEKNPVTPYGPAIFYPQIADMPAYHNNALWPFVASYWTLANAKAENSRGVLLGMGSVFRPAALFATNKENFNLDNGDIMTELNSSNMLWSLSGNLAITIKMLFGVTPEVDGISFAPFIPKELNDVRTLTGLRYRDMTLNITVEGYGSRIAKFYINGNEHTPYVAANLQGEQDIRIVMDNNTPLLNKVNETINAKAPLTPIAWFTHDNALSSGREGSPTLNLFQWQPIEYIDHYIVLRDGKQIATTNETSYNATIAGEYQVIGVDKNGIQSFASEPRWNHTEYTYEMPVETTKISSPEACNLPASVIHGYRGNGFAEVDHTTAPINISIDVKEAGLYSLNFRYANGNGPVNTENKCAIRTISVDKQQLGTIVMPQRGVGNWNDWGFTNNLQVYLTAGRHVVSVSYLPVDENMNFSTNHALIDRLTLRKIAVSAK
jgi:hypothetical protein